MDIKNISTRRPDLDWLRIILVIMLVPYHAAWIFYPYPWLLHNNQPILATFAFITILDRYHMQLLFLIAGAAIFFSLGKRSVKSFILERLQRLVVPLIFGMLVVIPPCYWITIKQFWSYQGSLWEFYPLFWKNCLIPFRDGFSSATLWFLWYLVFYTIALSPFLILIRKKVSEGFFNKLSRPFENPLTFFALFIPIALVQIQIYALTTITDENFFVLYYAIFFIYGFFLFSAPGFEKGLNRSGPAAIVIAVITMALYMMLVFPDLDNSILGPQFWTNLGSDRGTAGHILFRILAGLCTWSFIISLLYLARKFLNFSNRFVSYGNDLVLPFYIIHATPIILIGWWIIHQPWSLLAKYSLIAVLAFVAVVGICEIIRRMNVTRFLFGMRLIKRPLR